MNATQLTEALFSLADDRYKDFTSALIPTVSKQKVIGIRVPALRKFAKKFLKDNYCKVFLRELPHSYHEENLLHGYLIESAKDYDSAVKEVNRFLPFVDNWAVCDTFAPKVFKYNKEKLLKEIFVWIKSDHTYTVRYGIGMLMRYFLDEDFKEEYLKAVANIKKDDYYIKMMIAWYFATALAKQYESTLPFIVNNQLDKWTHNKAISKASESYRISDDKKAYLKTLRI